MRILLSSLVLVVGCVDPRPEPAPVPPPAPYNWIAVQCAECGGDGTVTYDVGHFFVDFGLEAPGDYPCPMCRGSGKLYKEVR